MKKHLFILLIILPFWVNAQVQAPGTVETVPSLLTRIGWTVTANSGVGPDGSYEALFDGDNATYWNSNYNDATTNQYPHILTIDMQSSQTYQGIMIRPRDGSRKPQSITFRKSNDGTAWTDITTVTGENVLKNQYFNFSTSHSSQYIQVELTTGYGDNNGELAEIAPYTLSVPDPTAYSRVGWVATGSSTQGTGGSGDNAGYAATLDGDISSYWHSQYSPQASFPHYLEYDMQQALKINKISLINRAVNNGGAFYEYTISYKENEGDSWTILPGTFSSVLTNPTVNDVPLGQTIVARYIRLTATKTGTTGTGVNAMMAEFRAHYDQTLPVTFANIGATIRNGQLFVNWSTETENNNSRFEIEVSANSKNFTKIGEVKSKAVDGNSGMEISYDFTMGLSSVGGLLGLSLMFLAVGFGRNRKKIALLMITAGLLTMGIVACSKHDPITKADGSSMFVRIKQVDKNGAFKYSKVVKAVQE
ncbi:MAG: discoidin domain-containing protein [Niabella sp.]